MAAREEEFDRGVQHGSVDHKVTASAEKKEEKSDMHSVAAVSTKLVSSPFFRRMN